MKISVFAVTATVTASIATQTLAAESTDATLFTQFMDWIEAAGHEEMTPMGMFLAADWVVKAVMLSLLFASVLVWVIFFAKMMILLAEQVKLRRRYQLLDELGSLASAQSRFAKKNGVLGQMIRAAAREQDRSRAKDDLKSGIKERVASEVSRIEAGSARRMGAGVGILANIGSTAPFVGLFGTVWGIMNSFISISESNTTNLAIVAPGIAEALLATAIGLVAAIPAVIFYNILARGIGGYKVMLADAGALVERTLSRDLDLHIAQADDEMARPREVAALRTTAAE